MSRRAKRFLAPSSEGDGVGDLSNQDAVVKKVVTKAANKKKEPVNLSEADIFFIVEECYQRRLQHWTHKETAKRAGVRRSTIGLIENFQRGVSLRVADSLATAYSSTIDFFINAGRLKKDLPEFQYLFPKMPK